nr:PF20097 family protein [uncultured Eisenbergiella sp.]
MELNVPGNFQFLRSRKPIGFRLWVVHWYPEDKESFLEKAENSITIKNTYQFERPAAWLCFHCHKLVMDVPERANFRFAED